MSIDGEEPWIATNADLAFPLLFSPSRKPRSCDICEVSYQRSRWWVPTSFTRLLPVARALTFLSRFPDFIFGEFDSSRLVLAEADGLFPFFEFQANTLLLVSVFTYPLDPKIRADLPLHRSCQISTVRLFLCPSLSRLDS